jgi:hypothetical protein
LELLEEASLFSAKKDKIVYVYIKTLISTGADKV